MLAHEHRVRSYEVDHQGFIFNGRYLEFVDVAMTEYFRHLGWPYTDLIEQQIDPSVVHIDAKFHQPGRLDQQLGFMVECSRIGTSSFVLDVTIQRDTSALAKFKVTYVNVDAAAETSRPLPEDLKAAMQQQRSRA